VEQARLKPGEAVLDVGCGTGGVTIPAKIRVGEKGKAAGIDPSPEMIANARRKAKRAGLEIDFQVGVIESLAFPDNTFDVVTSSLMMHHLPKNLQVKGLNEIKRVLKPSGRLLIADMRRPSKNFFKRHFTPLAIHNAMRRGHSEATGLEDLPAVLQAVGFEGIELLDSKFLIIGFIQAKKPGV
jgi:ubiquinone/menaquinone biosynthesis C-methylase UbiE